MNRHSPIYKAHFVRFNTMIDEMRKSMTEEHSTTYIDDFINDVMMQYLEANGYTVTATTAPDVVEERVS